MFNNTFYPTPKWLARKMIEPWGLDDREAYVLDPSAGKGDILDAIRDRFDSRYRVHLYAVEIEPELRSILEGKGYPVVGFDFLFYSPRIHFTHIAMNPPFNDAEDHLLHAWDMLYQGEIACLMNATSLEGKTIKEQTIKRLIADHGSAERVGQAFAKAERPTRAEIVLVRLTKKAQGGGLDYEVRNDRGDPEFDDGTGQEIALRGFVANLLAAFNATLDHYEAYTRARQVILRYIAPFSNYYDDSVGRSIDVMKEADQCKSPAERYNVFVSLLQEAAWSEILDHPGFQHLFTERARNMMKEFRARQKRVDFNEHNIQAMLDALMLKRDEILTGAVLDAFDTMTKYHEFNRIYFEGWKSNKAWKVNRKVVLPNYIRRDLGHFQIIYGRRESLCDIDRAMCVVSGRPYTEVLTISHALETTWAGVCSQPGITESTFFHIRWFIKGTIHLKFLDETLWKDFNLQAARGRSWLPPGE